MKVVLSRKGVDSSSGGFASPILSDGGLIPIAIPDQRSPIRYRDLQHTADFSALIKQLSHGRFNAWSHVHLDPDLNRSSLLNRQHFTPAFGQCGAAQSHLASHGVGEGDLFLFFGWFRQVHRYRRRWRYVPDAPDLHVIFGWLQVEQVLSVSDVLSDEKHRRLRSHPHCFGKFSGDNTLYVGRQSLSFNASLPGAGVFDAVSTSRTLTAEGCNRSVWDLPRWMYPHDPAVSLSYHQDRSRWSRRKTVARLQSVARGQEFVLDTAHYPDAPDWVAGLFSS